MGRAAIFLSLSSRPADLLERPPKVTSTTLSKVSHYSGGPRRWLTLCGTQYKVTPVLEFIELAIGYSSYCAINQHYCYECKALSSKYLR